MRKLISLLIILGCFSKTIVALSMPTSSAWNLGKNPDGSPNISPLLTEWQALTDPNYIFYRDLPNVNESFILNSNRAKYVPLVSYNTLETPAQFVSGKTDLSHLYTQWASTPLYVTFGGSQSEGQVLAPPPGLIRAAHINGAKILGCIFLSPPVYGGDKEIEWVKEMVKPREDGSFLYADQLINIAHAYHFDGYFINQEAILYNEAIDKGFIDFINYFHKQAPDLIVDWYQVPAYFASRKFLLSGSEVFLDYGALINRWADVAKEAQFPLENMEYGINGLHKYTLSDMTLYLNDTNKYQMSIGHFAAEKVALHNSDKELLDLETALHRIKLFWNGDAQLAGVSSYVLQQSAATKTPFFTNFNVGQGNDFFINGEKTALGKWYSPELQTILPVLQNDPVFSAQYDFETVFNGGNSLSVNVAPHEGYAKYILFNTQLKSTDETILSVVYRNTSEQTSQLCVTNEAGKESCLSLFPTTQWQHIEIALNSEQWTEIIIQSKASEKTHTIHLGQIYMGEPQRTPAPVSTLKYTTQFGKNIIEWKKPKGAAYYDIYKIISGESSFIARTYNTFFCIDDDPHAKYVVKSRALNITGC